MIKTTSTGWFSRIGNSFGGMLFGLLLFLLSFALLFWNEGRAVKRARDLEFGAENVIKASAAAVNPKSEGKLVHVSGAATATGPAVDQEFGVQAKALRLEREVEMYQWKEKGTSRTKKKMGGSEEKSTQYTYEMVWEDDLLNSSDYEEAGHVNPSTMPYSGLEAAAPGVKIGAYNMAPNLMGLFNTDTPFTAKPTKMPAGSKMAGNLIYIGASAQAPKIGDVRISYKIAPLGAYSIVAGQQGGVLIEYAHEDLNDPVILLERGNLSPEAMFKSAQDSNSFMTLMLRFVGFFMMFFGLRMISKPLSVLADILPFVGTAVGFVTGFVSFFIALGFSMITIAIAWIFYRPLIGILMLVVAGGAIAAAIALSRKASKA